MFIQDSNSKLKFWSLIYHSTNGYIIGGLGPGGLDSDRIPENERDWDS